MLSRSRSLVAPAYLFACLVLGGSAQGIWQNMVLQLAGLALIVWAALEWGEGPLSGSARQLLLLAIGGIAVVLLQLIPLPPGVWTSLGPRSEIAQGYSVLELPVPPEPLSLAPTSTLDSLLWLIPPIAMFCAMVRLCAFRPMSLAVALVAGTIAGVALGALQVASYRPEQVGQMQWYLYAQTNAGKAVGFFANADHMATLLVITIPFIAGMIARVRRSSVQSYSASLVAGTGVAIVIAVGLALNGSLAGYVLGVPVFAASALILIPRNTRLRKWIVSAAFCLLIGAGVLLELTPVGAHAIAQDAATSVQSRAQILRTTWIAIRDFMPWGSGLGSFRSVYPLYELPQQLTATYVIHAHNDYAELILELGVGGLILALLFLAWWASCTWRVWRTSESNPFARAATIATAAVLVHSSVDFPLRTAAIAACFAASLALITPQLQVRAKDPEDLRPTRHVRI